jgi:hypothetical protein
MLNEFAQWGVLLILTVFVVGLTRQLGYFIRSPEEQRGSAVGPGIGDRLTTSVFPPAELSHVKSAINDSGRREVALMVTNPSCEPCAAWLELLENSDVGVPLVVLTSGGSADYVESLKEVADLAIVGDKAAMNDAGLTATPFLMLLDAGFRVREKQLGGDPVGALRKWTGAPSDVDDSNDDLTVMTSGTRSMV